MAVRAKFRYTGYTATHMSRPIPGADMTGDAQARQSNYETVEARTLTFNPVYSTDPASENRLFWQATPSGKIELQMVNPEAWSQFEMGREYYIDFSPSDTPPPYQVIDETETPEGLVITAIINTRRGNFEKKILIPNQKSGE